MCEAFHKAFCGISFLLSITYKFEDFTNSLRFHRKKGVKKRIFPNFRKSINQANPNVSSVFEIHFLSSSGNGHKNQTQVC